MYRLSALATALCLVFGCGEQTESPSNSDMSPPAVDAMPPTDSGSIDAGVTPVDAGSDAEPMSPDTGLTDAALPSPDMGPWMPGPAAPETELERVTVSPWYRATVGNNDPLYGRFERGEFEVPTPGPQPGLPGINWVALTPEDDGTVPGIGSGTSYLVGGVSLDEGEFLVIRADRAAQMWSTVSVQPGDFYGSGISLMPLPQEGPDAVIAVRPLSRRGAPRIQVFKTTDEVVFNLRDLTWPHLVVGQSEPLPLGVPLVNNLRRTLKDLNARVLENEYFEASSIMYPGLTGGATTQVAFQLTPKAAWAEAGAEVPVRIRVESPALRWSYERTINLSTIAAGENHRRTFLSPVDGSVQYYGVRPPSDFDPEREYSLVMSLHGAGVEAINQTGSYAPKHWAYVIAPTNRRPFGFDWEEWGRFNALASLDHAMDSFTIDPTRVYLTGHSMGGHGTWHVGTSTPGRFAVLGPSAGWESFYSYGGSPRPQGPFARSRAHSDTLNYLSNIADRGVYIVHGDADDNVPIREGRNMFMAASQHTNDIEMHEEPGAGHWWNGDAGPGVDCVDWPPMFQFMKRRRLDALEMNFTFRSEGPSYSPDHSFIRVETAESPLNDVIVTSRRSGQTVTVETTNIRTLRLDAAALTEAGILNVIVDGADVELEMPYTYVGSMDGKIADRSGPLNQVFRAPFCFVYPSDQGGYAKSAAYFASYWALIGNGHACGVTTNDLNENLMNARNLIRMGSAADGHQVAPFSWNEAGLTFGEQTTASGALFYVFPEGERLSAALVATPDSMSLLNQIVPFSSRSGMPDYMLWTASGYLTAGFFDNMWRYDANLGTP